MKGISDSLKSNKLLKAGYIRMLQAKEKSEQFISSIIFTIKSKNVVNVVQKTFEKSG